MQNKLIVIGGSSGIGKAIAHRFAEEGWQVMIGAPDWTAVKEVVKELPGTGHQAHAIDLADATSIQRFAGVVKKEFGTFHTLVNSAGVSGGEPINEPDWELWRRPLEIMLFGAARLCRALIPLLEDGGRVIHITSIHHERVVYGSSAYGMAKAAVTQLTRSLAVELAPRQILANAIAPGFVDTPMSVKGGKNELESQWFHDNYVKYDHLPLKRPAQPEEIAGVAWFLAGPDASYITGSVLTVDGGLTITF
ncbi:MAG: SDR family oxidoreductase [Saprospiraceae bacterium]